MNRVDEAVRDALARGVGKGAFPGGAACVLREGKGLSLAYAGNAATHPAEEAIRPGMLYDVASLTKVIATTPVVMRLVHEKKIDLDRSLGSDNRNAGVLADATARQLMAHCSGLPDWRPYYEDYDGDPDAHRRSVYSRVFAEPLEVGHGQRESYSDLGFWALQELIERVVGRPFPEIVGDWVLGPLALSDTHFCLSNRPVRDRTRYVPTRDCPWRKKVLCGEVEDENAWAMGGGCSHAGLFSTAADVARFGAVWLDWYHGRKAGWGELPRLFAERAGIVEGSDRCLGWDGVTPGTSSSGTRFGPKSFGHTGFTGTSLWIDPEPEVVVVLLTNRVHPTRDNLGIQEFRPWFHDQVMEAALR